jgi:hypothetical protein
MAQDIEQKTYHADGTPDVDLGIPRNPQDDFGRSESDGRDMICKMTVDPTSYHKNVRQVLLRFGRGSSSDGY